MKIACIGGGPAGLYLGILVKREAPEHEVVIYERNRPDDTFGFGVVFSDATLDHLAAADPETHAEITARFARWDDIEVHVVAGPGGPAATSVLRSTGHGFCGLERKALLEILQRRARALGVRVEYEREVRALSEVSADVIVACDGAASWVRDALAPQIGPHVDVRPNKFVWLGCTVPYRAFTFIFKPTRFGLFRVHAYPYTATGSTFIVECRDETWRAAGLHETDEDRTIAILGEIFAAELGGSALVKNRSIWRNFPTVKCATWHAGKVVMLGDAAHTAHFSIGSGTKLAMEDSIALRDELLAGGDIGAALSRYEQRRRPEVYALQTAAQASLEWFEHTERYLAMPAVQLTYSLMTRSLRVSHASMMKRDPDLARAVEQLLADAAGVTGPAPAPTDCPFVLPRLRTRGRIVHAPDGISAPPNAVAHARDAAISVVDVRDAKAVAAIRMAGGLAALRVAATRDAGERAVPDCDLVVLDPGRDPLDVELLPATIHKLRASHAGAIAAVVREHPVVLGHVAQVRRAGADLAWIAAHDDRATLELSDHIRNELGFATAVALGRTPRAALDATIAAGRADLVAVPEVL